MSVKKRSAPHVTIHEMAKRLGIAASSVSYALNGQPGVGEATRKRVLALADELDWHPSSSARALSRARTDTIGMVLRRDPQLLGHEPYYMSLLSGVEEVLTQAGQSLLLRMVGWAPGRDLEIYRQWSAERRVDGVIAFDRLVDDPRPALLQELGMPYVMHGMRIDPISGETVADHLVADAQMDAHLIVSHLADLGHRYLIALTGPLNFSHEIERRAAITREALQREMIVRFVEGDYTRDGAARLAAQRIPEWAEATGFISSNDVMALGLMTELKAAGRGKAALVSWDDSIICDFTTPSITALARHPELQGKRSAETLLNIISGKREQPRPPIPSTLIVRETSVPAELAKG